MLSLELWYKFKADFAESLNIFILFFSQDIQTAILEIV